MIDEEYRKSFERGRKILLENQAKIPEEQRKRNAEFSDMLQEYHKRFKEGLPFQMYFTYEELKEALETNRPFETWDKFKGYYGPIPEDWVL